MPSVVARHRLSEAQAAASGRSAWSIQVERDTIASGDPELSEAIERFRRLDLADQLTLAREVARTRQAELTLAYSNVVTVASGFKTCTANGSERLTRVASVLFIVHQKWKTNRAGIQRIPSYLLTYRSQGITRELVAVPTDVQHERQYATVAPHGANAVAVDDLVSTAFGVLTCIVRVKSAQSDRRLAMSALHVLSVTADASYLSSGATVRCCVTNQGIAPTPMALTLAEGGRLVIGGTSFDVQLARITDSAQASRMFPDIKWADNEPFVGSEARLTQLVAANLPIDIMVADNAEYLAAGEIRPTMSASFAGTMEWVFPLPYDVRVDGVIQVVQIRHAELLKFEPFGGLATREGDSGSAVVCRLDDDRCTLVAMVIGGDGRYSYAIPAWRLFHPSNYFGALDGVTLFHPVDA